MVLNIYITFTIYRAGKLLLVGEIQVGTGKKWSLWKLVHVNSAEPLPQWKSTHLLQSLTTPRGIASNTCQGKEIHFILPKCHLSVLKVSEKNDPILLRTLWRNPFSRAILLLIKPTKPKNSREPCTCSVSYQIKLVPASSILSNTDVGKSHSYYAFCELPQLYSVTAPPFYCILDLFTLPFGSKLDEAKYVCGQRTSSDNPATLCRGLKPVKAFFIWKNLWSA